MLTELCTMSQVNRQQQSSGNKFTKKFERDETFGNCSIEKYVQLVHKNQINGKNNGCKH